METYYIDKYTVEVEMGNARIGDSVDVTIKMTNGGKVASAYKAIRFADDDSKSIAQRAMFQYRMGLAPNEVRIDKEKSKRGFVDESGCRRHTMTSRELDSLYRRLESFVADCTREEYNAIRDSITDIYTMIHKRINAETDK